jgi:hypothetical protein
VGSEDERGYAHLVNLLKEVSGATVIMDRRRSERRRSGATPADDRRRFDRRVRRPEATGLGYRLIRFAVRDSGGTPVSNPRPPSSHDHAPLDPVPGRNSTKNRNGG